MKIKKIIGWVLATMPIWMALGLIAHREGWLNVIGVAAGTGLLVGLCVYGIKIVVVDD